MRTDENYSYGVDVTSEVIIAAECAPGGDRIAYLRQDFDETDRQLRIEGAGEPLEFSLPPGTQGITWSPEGDRVAYVTFEPQAGYTLATIDLATGESTEQVRGLGIASSPRWSPDGSRIAFHAPSALVEQIWTYEVDSGAERPTMVTDGDGAFDPEWTPDGQSLIMSAIAEDETFQIFNVDPDTGETEAITSSADIFKRLPRYSPGGDTIAYTGSIVVPQVSRTGDSLHSFGIFLMGDDGSDERPLTADPRENPGAQVDPYLDAILVGWCSPGEWLNDTWTLREPTPTPALQ